jgi:hypothetical protein
MLIAGSFVLVQFQTMLHCHDPGTLRPCVRVWSETNMCIAYLFLPRPAAPHTPCRMRWVLLRRCVAGSLVCILCRMNAVWSALSDFAEFVALSDGWHAGRVDAVCGGNAV